MKTYKVLSQQIFTNNNFSIVPIRYEDRLDIMRWRNEQIYHLRQLQPLTQESQDNYFNTVIASLFEEEKPKQILFSYLENDTLIGYGGLVHIDWNNENAEISFVMNTSLEKDFFVFHWCNYLQLIEQVAFKDLQLHKLFIYAYNLRPKLYEAVEQQGFYKEAILKEHILFDDKFIDVVIHSKINNKC
ncbi:MAG: GNAT family N-acetyltransferase [Bacteroidetes bacterium]|nr:GNAT family N-acetyltransferase [Bacteroidota bacterium]